MDFNGHMENEANSKKRRKRDHSAVDNLVDSDSNIESSTRLDLENKTKVDEKEELQSANVDPLFDKPTTSYKVLGQTTFTELKKLRVTSKWIAAGATFPADLDEVNLADLDHISGLHPSLFEAVKKKISRWFPVQKAVLPSLIEDTNFPPILPPRDLAISAPTGSGKTLCYIIPVINSLTDWTSLFGVRALIVAPIQSLVLQIENEFKKFDCFNIPTALLCGHHDLSVEKRQLESAVVVFATSGRLMEHLFDAASMLNLSHLRYLVIDEADRMHQNVRLEWLEAVEVAAHCNKSYTCINDFWRGNYLQKILVSATLSHDVEKMQIWRLRYPRLFRASTMKVQEIKKFCDGRPEKSLEKSILPTSLKHEILLCETKMKPLAVYSEILKHSEWGKILIFVNNKLASQRLTILLNYLTQGKFAVEEFSSNLFGHRRVKVLKRFMNGSTKVLISSDVLSRGVDVQDIDAVVNYDAPKDERHFVHRVGRTARSGKEGTAVTVVTMEERTKLEGILVELGAFESSKITPFAVKDQEALLELYKSALGTLKESVETKQKRDGSQSTFKKESSGKYRK